MKWVVRIDILKTHSGSSMITSVTHTSTLLYLISKDHKTEQAKENFQVTI